MKKTKEISGSPEEPPMPPKIDFDEINKVVKLLEDRNLSEFEIEVEGFKLKIGRNPKAAPAPVAILPAASLPGPAAAGDHAARAAEAFRDSRRMKPMSFRAKRPASGVL
jgi:biotin carboxyl carrier protein